MKIEQLKDAMILAEEYELVKVEYHTLKDLADTIIEEDRFYQGMDFNVTIKDSDKRILGMQNLDFQDKEELDRKMFDLGDPPTSIHTNHDGMPGIILEARPGESIQDAVKRYVNERNKGVWENTVKRKESKFKFSFNSNDFLVILSGIITVRRNRMIAIKKHLKSYGVED